MPAESRFVGNSIEELLVALAEGVRDAQVALNAGPLVDTTGRPLATYSLPFLDFTINVEMTTQVDSGGRPVALLFAAQNSQTATAVRSNISGRLVATPPGDGLPVPRLVLTAGVNIGGKAVVIVRVSNSAGELLVNQPVELNIDDEASALLSGVRGRGAFSRLPGTRLRDALLTTGADGAAATLLLIDDGQQPSGVVVVVANVGPFSARGAVPLEVLG